MSTLKINRGVKRSYNTKPLSSNDCENKQSSILSFFGKVQVNTTRDNEISSDHQQRLKKTRYHRLSRKNVKHSTDPDSEIEIIYESETFIKKEGVVDVNISDSDREKNSSPVPNEPIPLPNEPIPNDPLPKTLKEYSQESATANVENEITSHSFYYFTNFLEIIHSVLNDENYSQIINNEDRDVVNKFYKLSDFEQKLYIRLFQRKFKWLRLSKIIYPEISGKSSPDNILSSLASSGFLDSILELKEVSEATNLLFQPELKQIAKKLNFSSSLKGKNEIKDAILKHCQLHKSSSSLFKHSTSLEDRLMKILKSAIDKCYILKPEPRKVFSRLLMLYSLPTMTEDENDASGGQQQQLLTLLMVNQGKLKFAPYEIVRSTDIFPDRESFLQFESAKQLENEILSFIEAKNFNGAFESYSRAKSQFLLLKEMLDNRLVIPDFLRKFTAHYVYIRCLCHGVEILQRLKNYDSAVEQLGMLLDQKDFCQNKRGDWWDRLSLNYHMHLKQPEKSLEVIKLALEDKYVKRSYYYNLHNRGQKLKKQGNTVDFLPPLDIIEAPKVTIQGRLFPRNIPGHKTYFISQNFVDSIDGEETAMMSVEELAINHYKQNGFNEGLHGEGSTFISLFSLLFWDIIYGISIPDVFQSPYQTHPLDLNYPTFYERRREEVNCKLTLITNSATEDLTEIVKTTWESNFSTASLVSWDNFSGVNQLLGLLKCIPGGIMSKICERFAKDFRENRSGFPDLVVWNRQTNKFKIVEVKGPGDRLSPKQILWMDYLIKNGVQAEVCHVEAIGAKRLKKE